MDAIAQLLDQARERTQLPSPTMRKLLRRAAGLSQQAIADAVGVTRQAVDAWERGEYLPAGDHLITYARLLRELQAVVS